MQKLNMRKYMCNINDNAVQGRLPKNAKNYRTKSMLNTKYSQFTVLTDLKVT